MNELVNNTSFLSMVLGMVIVGITQFCKKYGYNQKYIMIILAFLCALGYGIYIHFVQSDLQSKIVDFGVKTTGFAVLLYNMMTAPKEPLQSN